jgi:hypothetical protein
LPASAHAHPETDPYSINFDTKKARTESPAPGKANSFL